MTLETVFLVEANSVDAGMFRTKGRSYAGFRFFVQRTWREIRRITPSKSDSGS